MRDIENMNRIYEIDEVLKNIDNMIDSEIDYRYR